MDKLVVFFLFAIITNVLCMSVKNKRQSNDDDDDVLDDRYGWELTTRPPRQFPGQGFFPGLFPGQGQFPGQQQRLTTTRAPNNLGTTTMSPAIQQCIRSCPVTAEYNPVCGTDNITYNNPGRLTCAQACGINVSVLRSLPCPTATQAPTS